MTAPRGPVDGHQTARGGDAAVEAAAAPDDVAPDGSPVALYRALAPHDAADMVLDLAPAGGSILDLGCGTGRLATPLADAGLAVTGVDNHPGMVAALPAHVDGVVADLVGLDLGRPFDVVVLASHLVNHDRYASDFLATCRRHVAPDGVVLVERFEPGMLDEPGMQEGAYDGVHVRHEVRGHVGPRFWASAHYTIGDRTWVQHYAAVLLGDDELADAFAGAGLVLEAWLDDDARWALGVPKGR